MTKKYILLLSFSFLFAFGAFAQLGGRYSYTFLEQPLSARISALGANQASINDNDINIGYVNPSLITPEMNNDIAFNYTNFFAGMNFGSFQYAHSFENVGNFVATLQFMDYGEFNYADETGNVSGTFGASDMALAIGWGRQLDSSFSIGANAKFIYSFYEGYTSLGFAVDVAGTYQTKNDWTMSLIARNFGMQLTTYTSDGRAPLPFNLQYALSKRLEHVPFRFTFIFNHLTNWNLVYDDPNNPAGGTDPITGEPIGQSGFEEFGTEFLAHLVFGGEIYIGKNLVVRGGYNFQRRQELALSTKPGMVGFSYGFGVRISKFKINYSRSQYLTGSPNYLSLTVDIDAFGTDKTVKF